MQVKQGKLNFTTMTDLPEEAPVLTGTFSIRGYSIKVLFNSGATHSFINGSILSKLGLSWCQANRPYMIVTPGGKIASSKLSLRVPLEIGSKIFSTNLITLSLDGIDVIVGMDWME